MADWDEGNPGDNDIVSQYPSNARAARSAVKTNFGVDHREVDDTDVGKHEKLTLIAQPGDPASSASQSVVYAKTVSGVVELFYRDSGGTVRQLTTGGVLVMARIPTLTADKIPNLNADKITSGTFDGARIPNLAAGKITSGTFDGARIPNLAAGKITSGTFDGARIPNLAAGKITSGTFATARIPTIQASKAGAGVARFGSDTGGSITVSTGNPTGTPADNDIWIKRES